VESIAFILNTMFRMLGCLVWWSLRGIYSHQPLNGHWGRLLLMGAPDSPVRHRIGTVGCPVRRHVTQPLGFGSNRLLASLSSCGTGQVLFIVRCASDFCSDFCHAQLRTVAFAESTVARVSRCSAGAPDSLMNYSGVRLLKPESGWFIFVRTWCARPQHTWFLLLL
jgi:hypothetical protein